MLVCLTHGQHALAPQRRSPAAGCCVKWKRETFERTVTFSQAPRGGSKSYSSESTGGRRGGLDDLIRANSLVLEADM